MKKYLPYIFICVFSLIFISRFVAFVATQDVGIEHDSGWYLSVARNLAEKGIYASSINTIEGSDKKGAFPSIHGRFSVQDENGYSYFPAGVTVGPGFIVPEAIILKLFGSGWIQFRIFPLLCFSLLIVLLFTLVYKFGGIIGFALFGIWMWFYPQIWINQSFEAFSEQIALLYLMIGLVFISQKKPSLKSIIFGGLFIGLSIQTKSLFFLTLPAIAIVDLFLRKKILSTFVLVSSILFPTIIFEFYRYLYLSMYFGIDGYLAINKDIYLTMKAGGSGLAILKDGLSLGFIANKIRVWEHVGLSAALLGTPLIISIILKKKSISRFMIYVVGCFFVFFSWYVLLSQTGWFRHALPAVVLGMMTVSIIYSLLISHLSLKKQNLLLAVSTVCFFLTIYSLISSPLSIPSFVPTIKELNQMTHLFVNGLQSPYSAPIFSYRDQESVRRATSSISKNTRLCYDGWLLVAELPPIVNRVIYPKARCSKNDILVIGPYQRGPLSTENGRAGVDLLIQLVCDKTIYSGATYLLCSIR